MVRAERKLLKKAGFGREHKELGALACALEEVKRAPYVPGYAVEADYACGAQTRRRVRRLRRERMGRVMRRMLVVVGLYVGALLVVVLVVGGLYELLME